MSVDVRSGPQLTGYRRPGLKTPSGSKAAFSWRWMRASGALSGANTPPGSCRGPGTARRAHPQQRPLRAAQQPARWCTASAGRRPIPPAVRPTASAAARLRHDSRHSVAPPSTALARRRRTRRWWSRRPAQKGRPRPASMSSPPSAFKGRLHRRGGARQAQHQHAVPPGAGRQRQRLAAPLVEAADGAGLVGFEAQRHGGHRHRQHLQRHLADHAQMPMLPASTRDTS
jgi:hypothetical protein